MNRSPARPKRIMRPCTCASSYTECNCEFLGMSKGLGTKPPPFKVTRGTAVVMILALLVVIVGLSYLFGG